VSQMCDVKNKCDEKCEKASFAYVTCKRSVTKLNTTLRFNAPLLPRIARNARQPTLCTSRRVASTLLYRLV
jgi:hypothetical protein